MNDEAEVWRALADPTRRALLDLLRSGPRTTGDLAAHFPATRFAVMKHLAVLEEAGLVVVRRRGRERWNHLNAVPLRQAYQRWMAPYAESWAAGLLRVKELAETGGDVTIMGMGVASMDIAHELRIEAPPERVFDALTRMGEWWPHRFRADGTVVLEPSVGGRFYEDWGDGNGALYGFVTALRRPEHIAVRGPMGMAGPVTSVWTFDLAAEGSGTLLQGTHRAYGDISEETRAGYTSGWTEVTAALVAFLG